MKCVPMTSGFENMTSIELGLQAAQYQLCEWDRAKKLSLGFCWTDSVLKIWDLT